MEAGAEELVERLTKERERLMAALEGVDPMMADRRIEGTDGWTTIHDAMRHVASAESSMLTVARRTVEGTYKKIDDFDLNRYNARQVEKRQAQTWQETLAELQAARQDSLDALAALTEEQLALPTHHPVWGETTVGGLFRIIAIHDSLHRKDVETLKAGTVAQ